MSAKLAPIDRPPTRTVRGTLLRAANILVTVGWTQKAPARDAEGAIVSARSPSATCFCGIGAIIRASAGLIGVAFDAGQAWTGSLSGASILRYNDAPGRTKREVVAALRAAAKAVGR